MTVWVGLAVGLVLGWIAEWIVDWLYWRRNIEGFYATESELRSELGVRVSEVETLHSELAEHRSQTQTLHSQLAEHRSQVEAQRGEIRRLEQEHGEQQEKLAALRAEHETLASALAEARALNEQAVAEKRDDLEQIDGIGPVFEQRLFDAGIDTYADLAAAAPDRLRAIIQPQKWQVLDFDHWIEQACDFAKVKVIDLLPHRLEEISGIGPAYTRLLNEAGITTFTQLAACDTRKLQSIIQPKAWQKVDFSSWLKQARAFDRLISGNRPPHPLEEINGVGPVNAIRLEMANIATIADLAEISLDDLNNIIGAKTGRTARLEDWVEQAKEMVGVNSGTEVETAEEAAEETSEETTEAITEATTEVTTGEAEEENE